MISILLNTTVYLALQLVRYCQKVLGVRGVPVDRESPADLGGVGQPQVSIPPGVRYLPLFPPLQAILQPIQKHIFIILARDLLKFLFRKFSIIQM